MHRRDYPVQHRQYVVREIHCAVRPYVHLRAAQNRHVVAVLQPFQYLNLSRQAFRREAVGDPQALRVIGQRHVVVAHGSHGGHHLFQRKLAVAPVAVQVQVPPQILHRDQVGQVSVAGGVQLISAPPQLRRDPGQSQPGVEGLFIGELLGNAALDHRNPVFVQRQALPVRVVAQPDVVLLAPGEVLEHGAQPVRFADPQVDLDSGVNHHRGFRVSLHQCFPHRRQCGQCRPGLRRIV